MTTSNFRTSGNHPNAVAITATLPRYGAFKGRQYKALAPNYAWLHLPPEEYNRLFMERLNGLDPVAVFHDLGDEAVLLCYEDVMKGQVCHRRMVAEWLERHLGIIVTELGYEREVVPGYFDVERQAELKASKPKGRSRKDAMLLIVST